MENEREDAKENKIILLTIKNVVYPINTDVIYRVASLSGTVEKIVIFKKKFLQVTFFIIFWSIADKARETFRGLHLNFKAMVEYVDLESAKKAKESLQDKDMYDGCNTIKVEYARTQKLNVYKVKTLLIIGSF